MVKIRPKKAQGFHDCNPLEYRRKLYSLYQDKKLLYKEKLSIKDDFISCSSIAWHSMVYYLHHWIYKLVQYTLQYSTSCIKYSENNAFKNKFVTRIIWHLSIMTCADLSTTT